MKYLLSMIGDEEKLASQTPDQAQQFGDRIENFNAALREGGVWVSAEGLGPKAESKTVRFKGGTSSVLEGTASPATEQSLGYWVIQAASLDEAADWGRRLGLDDGIVEVRSLLE
jgi:hypothetical protein